MVFLLTYQSTHLRLPDMGIVPDRVKTLLKTSEPVFTRAIPLAGDRSGLANVELR